MSAPWAGPNARRGLVLGLALIAAFELVAASIPDHVGEAPPFTREGLRIKAEQAARPEGFDALFFGECYAYDGIIPDVIEQETGLSTYNLSVNRGHLWLSNYVLCERYLENAARKPRVLVLEVAPGAVAMPQVRTTVLFEANVLPLLGAAPDVFWAADWDGKLAVLDHLLSPPSVRKQYFLQRADWLPALLAYDHEPFRREMEQWRADRGYFAKERDPAEEPVVREITLPEAERAYQVHEFNAGFITRTIALAAEHGVPVLLFTPATCEGRGRAWHRHGVKEKHRAWLEEVRARHANVLAIIDLMDVVLPDAFVPDTYHPNRAGAERLSHLIGSRLRALLEGAEAPRRP